MQTKQDLINWLEENQEKFTRLSDYIWENPEIGKQEFKACQSQADFMEGEGFRITRNLAGMNTAFMAEWGQGKPVLGFAGEFDALLNLSQKNQAIKEELIPGGNGHGCGHNLLGVGCMAASVAVKQWLQSNGRPGTVRYYGCPGEESGDGKVYMARAGVFDDLDAAFNYHPMYMNTTSRGSSIGVKEIKYRFHGRAAHAGGSPHLGRSALDAVELMNAGVNYLREHVTKDVRIHYVITHGGDLPNIVPPEAEVWYFIRAHENADLESVTERVRKIAEGAALMTETVLEVIFRGACSKTINNYYLADLQYENMKVIGPIHFTKEENDYARKIIEQYPPEVVRSMPETWLPPNCQELADQIRGLPLLPDNYPAFDEGHIGGGSTDVGDLSQITPVSMFSTACWPAAIPGHSWGIVAVGAMSIAHKGMLHAAKIMALSAMDCYSDPVQLHKARHEFEKTMQGKPYICPIPPHIQPRQYEKEN